MAKNPPVGDGHREGAVRDRSQIQNPVNGLWYTGVSISLHSTDRSPVSGRFLERNGVEYL